MSDDIDDSYRRYALIDSKCYHEANGIKTHDLAPDYKPLTKRELIDVLDMAYQHKKTPAMLDRIQTRLVQAIPGMTCPRPAFNGVARRMAEVQKFFKENGKKGAVDSNVYNLSLYLGIPTF